jgi:hypothetical protein
MATNNRSGPPRRPKPRPKLSGASTRILREWRGYEEALDLNEGLHHPQEFIQSILESTGAIEGLHEDQVRSSWKQLAGDFIAAHTDPVSVKHGELVLRVSQPALRFQLERMKPELLTRIHQHLGPHTIQSIRFTHG